MDTVILVQSKETEPLPCVILRQDFKKITQEAYLADLDKNVVDFIPNYE